MVRYYRYMTMIPAATLLGRESLDEAAGKAAACLFRGMSDPSRGAGSSGSMAGATLPPLDSSGVDHRRYQDAHKRS